MEIKIYTRTVVSQDIKYRLNEEEILEIQDEIKNNRFEDLEVKVRKLIENTVSRFNFVKNEEYDRVEKRIEALEKKLNQLVKEIIESKKKNKENI